MKTNKNDQESPDKKKAGTPANESGPIKRKDPLYKNPSEFEGEEEGETENEKNRKAPVEEDENEYQKEEIDLPGVHQENSRITNAGQGPGRDTSQGSEFLN